MPTEKVVRIYFICLRFVENEYIVADTRHCSKRSLLRAERLRAAPSRKVVRLLRRLDVKADLLPEGLHPRCIWHGSSVIVG